MKINKDALLKQHFWILVVLTVPLAMVAILLLVTSVSSAIATARKKLSGELAAVNGAKDIKTPEDIGKLKVEADILLKHETTAWAKAFADQETLFRWPRLVETNYEMSTGRFANAIEILKTPADAGAWPADTKIEPGKDGLMHGILQTATDTIVAIKDAKGKAHTFHVTPGLIERKVANKDAEAGGDIAFNQLNQHLNKFVAVTYQEARYFNERLTDKERIDYMNSYHSQVPPILRQVDPLYIGKGEDGKPAVRGIVQFGSGWMFDPADDRNYDEIPQKKRALLLPPEGAKFLRFKHDDWIIAADFSEEAWIAQEDLWIQNEIYRLVRMANDSVARFEKVADPKAAKNKGHFKNPYFEITVGLSDDKKSLDLHIANRLNRRQKLDGLSLRLQLRDPKNGKGEPDIIPVSGDPLEPKGTKGKDTRDLVVKLKGAARAGIFGLEQVLTWESAAVKRIDHIALGSESAGDISFSQRTMPLGLRPYIQVAAKADEPDKAAPAPGLPPGMDMKKPFPGGPMGNQGGAKGALPNGFSPIRYQEVTPQFRRVPVAVALIVDQNHVDRVQTAFNNSKLRFLVTQVLLNHYPDSLRPKVPDDKPGGAAETPGAPAFPGGLVPGMPNMPGMPGMPLPNRAQQPAAAASGDLEANIELVLYGVVTLYERFPPRPAAAAAPAEPTKAP